MVQYFKESTDELSKEKIVNLEFEARSNDLKIKWESGAVLESFCLEPEQYSYHVQDKINKISYDVSYGKVSEWK